MKKVRFNNVYEIILPDTRAKWVEHQNARGGWESKRLDSIYQHTTGNDVMYYIGAEEGDMPALCQMWGAKVVVIEPNIAMYRQYKKIWRANGLESPHGFFGGFASNRTKKLTPVSWDGIDKLTVEGRHGFKELYLEADNYPEIKIDDGDWLPPTQMSIDVEGSEFEVLKGAEHTIDTYKPKIWLSLHPEFLIMQWNVYGTEVRNWVKGKGYTETILDYQHEVHLLYEPIAN